MKYVVEVRKMIIVEADSAEDAEEQVFNGHEIISEEYIFSVESEKESKCPLLELVL